MSTDLSYSGVMLNTLEIHTTLRRLNEFGCSSRDWICPICTGIKLRESPNTQKYVIPFPFLIYIHGFLLTPLTGKGMVQVNITDWCMSTVMRWLSTATGHPELDSGIWPLAVDRP
ncbi:hypothetical protein Taro_004253 [Colocasia esculenta]|uniref:Uncharacterized protein n=1 Tax=Colocasia esculenta TaxID=4460 RepID=A0A843TUA1_COLES|nr:hypothetical protein [Colocasia esculenta]